MHLLVIRSDQVLVHVAWTGFRQPTWKYCGIQQEAILVSNGWYRIESWSRQCTRRCVVRTKEPKVVVGEERRVEAEVLENVIVYPVVRYAESATNHHFLIPESIPGEAHTGAEIILILVPNGMAILERSCSYSGGGWAVDREKRVV